MNESRGGDPPTAGAVVLSLVLEASAEAARATLAALAALPEVERVEPVAPGSSNPRLERLHTVTLLPGVDWERAIAAIRAQPGVASAEPPAPRHLIRPV